jgi:arylsulfatase A-like enzyme
MRLARAAVVACGAALAALACAPAARSPNLVLVSIDSLRADGLGAYGAQNPTSPAIDALAAEGARFENAFAPTSWTLPSHVTLFTGLPIPSHRVDAPHRRIDRARHLLAEHLARHGYRTAGFVSSPFLQSAYGFGRGFEVYRNFQKVKEEQVPPSRSTRDGSHGDETAAEVIDAALAWLGGQPKGGPPWFLFVHLWDVHYDYIPPAPYDRLFDPDYEGDLDPRRYEYNDAISAALPERERRHLRALYDGEIRWTDSQLGRLLEALRERERHERIVIALLADHGDEFFEHGKKGHYKTLFDESVQVPWIVRSPGLVPAGTRVEAVAGLDDVAPTLLAVAGLPPLPEATGRDLSPGLAGKSVPARASLLTLRNAMALRGLGWKVLIDTRTGAAVYYDLVADRGEQRPARAQDVAPERLAAALARLRQSTAYAETLAWEGDGEVELDPETRARLRELGYIEE